MEQEIITLLEDMLFTSISMDTRLIDDGLVDSITSVDIVVEIEAMFNCKIPAISIPEVLQTPQTIVEYVKAHQNA